MKKAAVAGNRMEWRMGMRRPICALSKYTHHLGGTRDKSVLGGLNEKVNWKKVQNQQQRV